MGELQAVILAAGEGQRMRSAVPKVLHPLCGRPMLCYILDCAAAVAGEPLIVVGHDADLVREHIGPRRRYALQEKQLGTGDALMQALPQLPREGRLLVLCGDTPLLEKEHLEQLLRAHGDNAATVMTTRLSDPTGYGRVLRDPGGLVQRVVEEGDASAAEKKVCEINSGTYCFDIKLLRRFLPRLSPENVQREYYLTDILAVLREQGHPVGACTVEDWQVALGINDRCQLAEAAAVMGARINRSLMQRGVTLVDPSTAYIDYGVEIGADTVILPQTLIEGATTIGAACRIGPATQIIDAQIGDGVTVRQSVVQGSILESAAVVGPFAHIRPGCRIGGGAKVGTFVEVKNSAIGAASKLPHLSYAGDADIDGGVNIGAGAIIVNYDGRKKHRSHIGAGAFIGCNSSLISPLEIGEGAFVAAGTTVTGDVPAGALAIARQRQKNCEGLGKRLLTKKPEQEKDMREEKE
ncbi:MAG TPA: bifunctional UDP-N-acetylglucosamine diphosphorylase/glucosamine-1-phosphate N-acetyltransferase GlmU [Firmicutes bacterium]|nr:bifunctional UDP-N-acetylglucosamine diphosphorylase/glucosamine-1-phosphate N-acetyltransferase GlmU [Bacillota bacterium]